MLMFGVGVGTVGWSCRWVAGLQRKTLLRRPVAVVFFFPDVKYPGFDTVLKLVSAVQFIGFYLGN